MRASDPEAALRDFIAGAEVADDVAAWWLQTKPSATAIQIKICGVTNCDDARACVELGADMIGFNFYPASPRYVEPAIVRRIVDALPARTCAIGVFVDADPAEIRKLAKICRHSVRPIAWTYNA